MVQETSDREPRIALLGYGAIADLHVAALARAGVTPAVVAGPDGEQVRAFAQRHGIESATTDASEAIGAEGIDAVVLASPSDVHAAQAAEALAAGRHVLAEIPLALSYPEGKALVEQAASAERVLMVCHTLRYWQPYARLHEFLLDGGHDVRHVVATSLSLRLENVGWTGRRRSWTDDVLWHHGGHTIDAVLRLLGEPVTEVTAAAGPVWSVSGRSMDYAITLRTGDGAIASVALSYNARLGGSDLIIISDRDTVRVDGPDVTTSSGPLVAGVDAEAAQVAAIEAQDQDFLDAVTRGTTPQATAASILPVLAVQQQVADQSA